MASEKLLDIFLKAPGGVTTDSRMCGEGMIFALRVKILTEINTPRRHRPGCVASVVDNPELRDRRNVLCRRCINCIKSEDTEELSTSRY